MALVRRADSRVEDLTHVAQTVFGLEVRRVLPISESFSSTVLSFVATDDRHYIVKRPWAAHKGLREASALQALEAHPDVPALLAIGDHEDTIYLLIEGLDGSPWTDIGRSSPELLRHVGRSMRRVHSVAAESFDGQSSWHDLIATNANRYHTSIGTKDEALASDARRLLDRLVQNTPQSTAAQLVHFDLRPGNVLVRDGRMAGLIDFEACRGGHGSMDFFKLWQQVAPHISSGLADILAGYLDVGGQTEEWMDVDQLDQLMLVYSAYHGLAGLSWCYTRNDFSGTFPDINRQLIGTAISTLG